ncbi:hypothetical protein QFZ68_006004 [Streptomyces sp. V1I6]|nr:hypothetical protein [Streptomyces sp. V1I6]
MHPDKDTPSAERPGWRERAANLAGDVAFAVDYTVCAPCGLGWVEWPPRASPGISEARTVPNQGHGVFSSPARWQLLPPAAL